MSVKYFDKNKNKWVIFPGTVGAPGKNGKDAYDIAVEHGYEGSEEEYNNTLLQIPEVVNKLETIDNTPTKGSNNLVTSGGVKDAIDSLDASLSGSIENIIDVEISNQIKSSIVDNLLTDDVNKSLSAKQGKILKGIIDNLANIQFLVVDVLPSSDIKSNIIYLVKKKGSGTDVHDEYIYIENNWEKIGDTSIDLTNYYTKDQVDSQIQNVREDIPSIPDVNIVLSGSGNVITELAVDSVNKHKLVASKSISVYTKDEIAELGRGDVVAVGDLANNMLVIGAGTKSVSASNIPISDISTLKTNVTQLSDSIDKLTQQVLELDYVNSIDIRGDSGNPISINSQNHTISVSGADNYLATTVENNTGDLKLLIGHKSNYDHVPTVNQVASEDRIAFVPSKMTSYWLGVIGKDIRIPATGIDGLADVAKSGSYNDLTATPVFKSLHISAGELTKVYDPTVAKVDIDLNPPLDNRYEKLLGISLSAGDPGTFIEVTETAHTINVSNLTASRSEAIVVVRGDCTVNFSGTNIYIINNASDLAGTSTQRKVYTVKRIEDDSNNPMVLITCALYNPNN